MKKRIILLLLMIITISALVLAGCGKTAEKQNTTETNNNIDNANESKDDKTKKQDSSEDESQNNSDEDLEGSEKEDSDNELLPDGPHDFSYDPDDSSNQIYSARIENGFLYLDCKWSAEAFEYEKRQFVIPLSDTIKWEFSWFTEYSFNNTEKYDSIAVSEIEETFNKLFADKDFYYEHTVMPSGCDGWPHYSLYFEINDGKITLIYLVAEIG